MAFDPDKYLQEKSSNFDPDKYLSEKGQASQVSIPDSAMAGAVNQFNLAPAVAGAFGAVPTALDMATGGSASLQDVLDKYNQDRSSSLANFQEAEKQHPLAYAVGNLAGGFIPAAATLGASEGPSAAMTLGNAMKLGAGYGVAGGAGQSLSEGASPVEALKNVAGGALAGGATGGVLHGAGALFGGAKELAGKTKIGSELLGANVMGQEGENLLNSDTRKAIGQEPYVAGQQWVETLAGEGGLKSQKGKAFQDLMNQYKSQNIDFSDKLPEMQSMISQLDDRIPEEASDKAKLQGLVKNFFETPAVEANYTPQQVENTPATPTGLVKLQNKLAKLKDDYSSQGININTKIEPITTESGEKLLRGSYWYDEQVKGKEALVNTEVPGEVLGESIPTPGEYTKVGRQFENSPDGKQKAQKAIAKLKSKAKFEGVSGVDYQLAEDKEHGLYNVLEKGMESLDVTQTPSEQSVSLDTTLTPENYSSNIKNLYQPDNAGIPATQQVTPDAWRTNPTESLVNPEVDYASAQALKGGFQNYSGYQKGLASTKGENIAGQLAKLTGETNEKYVPGLEQANTDYHAVDQVLKEAGISGDDPTSDAEKIAALFYRNENQTKIGDTKRFELKQLADKLRDVDPELADKLQNDAQVIGKRVEIARKATNEGHTAGNSILGAVMGRTIQGSNLAGQAFGAFNKHIASMGPASLRALGDMYSSTGGEIGQKIGRIFTEASNRDDTGRNAIMFSLLQNPTYRQWLQDKVPGLQTDQQ